MNLHSVKCILALLSVAVAAMAGEPTFEPVPAEVWNLKLEDTQGTGALILKRRMEFDKDASVFDYRVRIVAEAGKEVLNRLHLPDSVLELGGRTVLRDGTVIPFTDKMDLLKRTIRTEERYAPGHVQRYETRERVVVPPGLSVDCVVDLHWKEPRFFMTIGWSYRLDYGSRVWPLALPWPIREEEVAIADDYSHSWDIKFNGTRPLMGQKEHRKTFLLAGLPALEDVPFALEAARGIPRLTTFHVPFELADAFKESDEAFWAAAGRKYFKPQFDKIDGGRAYRSFAEALLKDLPGTPQKAAYEVVMRLQGAIRNLSSPTYRELAALDKEAARAPIHPEDLDATVKRGGTSALGMGYLYFRLLQDAHLPIRILYVADRRQRLLDLHLRDAGQASAVLVGVPEEGRPVFWVDCSMRYAAPGTINPAYQGTPGLSFDPSTWKPEAVTVPVQAPGANVSHYACTLDLGEDLDRFRVEADFRGFPDYEERRLFLALDPAEQGKALRDRLEAGDRTLQILKAEVRHAVDPRENLTWMAEGARERDGGRRLTVAPFPTVPWPVPVPRTWPEERKDNIVMPCLGIHVASASFRIPDGYRLLPASPLNQHNAFGAVAWLLQQVDGKAGPEGKVVCRVDLETLVARPDQYAALQEFTGWIRDAMTRLVVLEQP